MKRLLIIALPALAIAAGAALPDATDYVTIPDGVLNICRSNTSSNYVSYSTPLLITEECPLTVYTSRYTEFMPDITGNGTLTLMCGGERTFIGSQKGDTYPDWSTFTGDVHVYPYNEVEQNAGFYGIVLNHGDKRFNPEDIAGSLPTTNSQLVNNRLFIHSGATLATPTGIRGVRLGEVNLEEGGRIYGSIKASSSNASYILMGCNGTDAVLAGCIAPAEKNGIPDPATMLGIIKEGDGTYRITGTNNQITAGVRVLQGTVVIANDIEATKSASANGAIGVLGNNTPGVYVFKGATVAGTGNCGSVIDLYGNLCPGDNGIGTLTVADFAKHSDVNMRLRPSSKLYFEIDSSDQADRLDIRGNIEYYNIDQDFSASELMPVVYIRPTAGCSINPGDSFTLISAKGRGSLNNVPWNLRIQYPKKYTWEVSEIEDADGYRLVATVVSLEYSGQGDVIIDDEEGDDEYVNDFDADYNEAGDPAYLRAYATMLGKDLGVAVSTWRYNIDSSNDISDAISSEFNMMVAENEMKFESLEPYRGVFTYNDGDRIVAFAQRSGATVRGHALAWHKQNPTWLSSDGGVKNNNNFSREELLSILEQHITKVVSHYKGKVIEWDVVNECLSDDQSIIRTDPSGYSLRPSIWYSGIGEDFIDSAFVYAHRADPNALLILNDYGVEFKGVAKTEAFYNLAKRLKDSGIPIHGVGLQCHLDVGDVNPAKLNATIDAFAAIGLTCRITELDLGIGSTSASELRRQALDYYAITKVVTENSNCTGMLVWGFADDHSWRGSWPLLWNNSHQRKPAYYGVHQALRRAATEGAVNDRPLDNPTAVSVRYYNIQGQPLLRPVPGIVIAVKTMSDGSIVSEKTVIR